MVGGKALVVAVSGPRLSYSAFTNAPESSQFWESIQTAQEMTKAIDIQGLTMRGPSALPRIALAFSPGETGVRAEGEADGGFATAGTGTT